MQRPGIEDEDEDEDEKASRNPTRDMALVWRARGGGQKSFQVLTAVLLVVKIQPRDTRLQEPPHRLAHVGGQPHEPQAFKVFGAWVAKVQRQQQPFVLLLE